MSMSSQRIWYHATFDPIKKFWPLSHFGTYKAAISRMIDVLDDVHDDGNPFYDRDILLYPVRLSIQNPFKTVDVYNERPYVVSDVAAYMLNKHGKKLSDPIKSQLHKLLNVTTTPKNTQKLALVLSQMGHDGLTYRNRVEDPGHYSMINLHSDQVEIVGEPLHVPAREVYQMPKRAIWESHVRPKELGDAYFWIDNKLVNVAPHRNHRDWLIAHQSDLGLDAVILDKPHKALWHAYQKGVIRLVWDPDSLWKAGAGAQEAAVLYINGFERDVWRHMRVIMNSEPWAGKVKTVVVEYVRNVNGAPDWFHTDIFKGGDLESLYRGRTPRRAIAPPNAEYGGEPQLWEQNHVMNRMNDQPGAVFEMWHAHMLSSTFFDTLNHTPRNGFQTVPSHGQDIYLGMTHHNY
jgi:hypothetical protein